MITATTARQRLLAVTAHHEAGHAVASWRLRVKFKHVTIEPGQDSRGHVLHDFPKWFQDRDIDHSDRIRLRAEAHIIVSLAGQIAEAKFRGRRPRWGMEGDNDNAVEMALRLFGGGKEADAFLRFCWCRAEGIVDANWKLVQAVGEGLLQQKTLKHRDVIDVILRALKANSPLRCAETHAIDLTYGSASQFRSL